MLFLSLQTLIASPWLAGIYLLLCILAGLLGREMRIGFWGYLFASILFTPFVSLIFMFFSSPVKTKE